VHVIACIAVVIGHVNMQLNVRMYHVCELKSSSIFRYPYGWP